MAPEVPPVGETLASRVTRYMNGFMHPAMNTGELAGIRLRDGILNDEAMRLALSSLEEQRQRLLADAEKAAAERLTPRWLALIAKDVLTAATRKALFEEMAEMRQGPGAHYLPYAEFGFGHRDICGVHWSSEPHSRATHRLVADGVVTGNDLRKARDIKESGGG